MKREKQVRELFGEAGVSSTRAQIDFVHSELPQDIADLGAFIPEFSLLGAAEQML